MSQDRAADTTSAEFQELHKRGEASGYAVMKSAHSISMWPDEAFVQEVTGQWVLLKHKLPDGRERTVWYPKHKWPGDYEIDKQQ